MEVGMYEYVVNLWFVCQTFLPDVTVMVRVPRPVEVSDVAEGALRLLGEYCAAYVSVIDCRSQQKTMLTDVVLNV
jgi:hypothetical protein